MKIIPLGIALLSISAGVFSMRGDQDQIVILAGDLRGYLSPCGCTSPMLGGIRRRATAIRAMTRAGRTIFLENGGMVDGWGPQDQMKADTLAQSLAELSVTAINVGPPDA